MAYSIEIQLWCGKDYQFNIKRNTEKATCLVVILQGMLLLLYYHQSLGYPPDSEQKPVVALPYAYSEKQIGEPP